MDCLKKLARRKALTIRSFFMASDNRDWYRAGWRKKTGYVERARFRMGEKERMQQKHKSDWYANWRRLAVLLLLLGALGWFARR